MGSHPGTLLEPFGQVFFARPQGFYRRSPHLFTVEGPVFGMLQGWMKGDPQGIRVDSEQVEVEEGVEVSAEQDAVGRVVIAGCGVGDDMDSFEGGFGVKAGDGAFAVVGCE